MSNVELVTTINAYPELEKGSIGEVRGSARGMDAMLIVYFPHLKRSYQIIDRNLEIYRTQEELNEWHTHLRSAFNVKHTEGPSGGFKCVTYNSSHPKKEILLDYEKREIERVGEGFKSIYDKKEGSKLLDFFKKNNIPIEMIILPRKSRNKK